MRKLIFLLGVTALFATAGCEIEEHEHHHGGYYGRPEYGHGAYHGGGDGYRYNDHDWDDWHHDRD